MNIWKDKLSENNLISYRFIIKKRKKNIEKIFEEKLELY